MLMQQATSSTGPLENRWLTPWWNQLRTWRCILSLSLSMHPLFFVSFHVHFVYPLPFSPLISSSHFMPSWSSSHSFISLASVSNRSTIKCECLQLILNYFKLFLLLPSEEVRNLSPPYILWKPKVPYILWKPRARPNLENALFLPLVVQYLSCPIYVSPVIQALQCTLQNQSDPFENLNTHVPWGSCNKCNIPAFLLPSK